MKLSFISAALLCSVTTFAIPAPDALSPGISSLQPPDDPFQPAAKPGITSRIPDDNTFMANWAGLVLKPPESGQSYRGVSGQFIVPVVHLPKEAANQANGSWAAAVWVGIDGYDSLTSSLLQAGIIMNVTKTADGGQTTDYYAWYEWLPLASVNLPDDQISVAPGDEIEVIILRSGDSFTEGIVQITNFRTRQVFQQTVKAPNNEAAVKGLNVEWIVEDFSAGFADFGTVKWTNIRTGAFGPEPVDWSNSDIVTLVAERDGEQVEMTKTTMDSANNCQIQYIG